MATELPDLDRPAFRALDMHPAERDGERGLVLIDRLGLQPEQCFVSEGLLPVLGLFDGRTSLDQIRAELARATGHAIPAGFLDDLVRQLDEKLLLHSPRFRAALQAAIDAFAGLSVRPARMAGSAGYPEDPERLAEALAAMVGSPKAPVRPAPRGLAAPHIDLFRGRQGYAQAYGYLAECEPADLYVVFGTGHQGPSAPVTGLRMDWQTPLGVLPTDRDFVDAVHEELGPPAPEDLFLHRDEHSLEFQMLFLQYLAGRRGDAPRVAGFLCGQLPSGTGDPTTEDYLPRLLHAFRRAADRHGGRVCYLAGADLAHLGPQFGDSAPVDAARLQTLDADDRRRLAPLLQGRPGEFHRLVMERDNPDRICGASAITLAALLAGGPAELLHYGQAPADDGSQVVSFCSLAFGEL